MAVEQASGAGERDVPPSRTLRPGWFKVGSVIGMAAGLIIGIAAGVIGGRVWLPEDPVAQERRHQEAMDRWLELVRNDFNADKREVYRAFGTCFRLGDRAEPYQRVFATADMREELGVRYPTLKGKVSYTWRWQQGPTPEGNGIDFDVLIGGTPPVIINVQVAHLDS